VATPRLGAAASMKILSVSHSFHPETTGVGNAATSLVREWLAAGHDVSVVTSVGPTGVRATEEIGRTKRFRCSGNWVRGMQGEIDGYRNYLVDSRLDIIVVHCALVWCVDALFSFAERLQCPVALVSHPMDLPSTRSISPRSLGFARGMCPS
jgi:glycosyl transferase family 4